MYQYTFEPNIQWSKYFAPGAEILDYVQGVARRYGIDKKVKYNMKVIGATWNDEDGVWVVKSQQTSDEDHPLIQGTTAEVVINAVGILNNWKRPDIDGIHDFKGKLLHSANWDNNW